MVDNFRYLELLQEFELLLTKPDNVKYNQNRVIDHVGLMLVSISQDLLNRSDHDDTDQIARVYSEINFAIQNASISELKQLKKFLEEQMYVVKITNFALELAFRVSARTFDLTTIID